MDWSFVCRHLSFKAPSVSWTLLHRKLNWEPSERDFEIAIETHRKIGYLHENLSSRLRFHDYQKSSSLRPLILISSHLNSSCYEALNVNCGYKAPNVPTLNSLSPKKKKYFRFFIHSSIPRSALQSHFAQWRKGEERYKKHFNRFIWFQSLANSHPFSICLGCVNTDISRA